MKITKTHKSLLLAVAVTIAFVLGTLLSGCGASFERSVKDFQSEYSGGLNRTVTAYSMTGEKIGEWKGKIDIEISDNKVKFDLNGKRTIIYNAIVITQED